MLPSIETLQILARQVGEDGVSSQPHQTASPANVPSGTESQAKKRCRVLIIENHPAVRQALALRIGRQHDLEVGGQTADMVEALRLVADMQPDVAVVDLSLRNGNAIDLIQRIQDHNKSVGILVWSLYSEVLYAGCALQAGALGFITKDEAASKIVEAIRRVADGKIWLSQEMAQRMLDRALGRR
jgi:DNA-binding NarL/FixJ family response regulator